MKYRKWKTLAAEQRAGLYIDDTVKILGKKLKDIILLYFRAISLDLLRFSCLLEDHLHLTWMQTEFFWTLFVPHTKEKYVKVAVCGHPLRFLQMFRNDLLPSIGSFPWISLALNGRESTCPRVPSHRLFSHTPSPLWTSTEDGWCLYSLIMCAGWMGVDKQETVLELRTKNIPHHCVWEASMWSSHMGLHMYGNCELPANNNTWQSPPRSGSLLWGWKQPKYTWMLPKGSEFFCCLMWLGPESAGWPWLIKFSALHPFPPGYPREWCWPLSSSILLYPEDKHNLRTEYCCVEQNTVDVTTESQAKAYWHTWDCNELTLVSFGSDAQSCKIFLTL